jgi:hypothetical protein
MTSPTPRLFRDLFGLTAATALLFGTGCGSESEPEPVAQVQPKRVAPAPPPPPPAPKVTSIADLMQQLAIDPRVNLTEDQAPDTTDKRIAVLRFFDAFARGDANALADMLSPTDALLLKRMVDSGDWADATANIGMINVQTGSDPTVGDCALALIMVGTSFEPQLWSYEISGDPAANGGSSFDALPCPPDMVNKLSGDNWITAWMKILADELARSTEPDEIIEFSPTDLSEEEEGSGYTGGPPGLGGGGGQPGRKRPSGPVVDPNPQGPGGPTGR